MILLHLMRGEIQGVAQYFAIVISKLELKLHYNLNTSSALNIETANSSTSDSRYN